MQVYSSHDLGPGFEPLVLSCCLDQSFMDQYRALIAPEAFRVQRHRTLAQILLDFYDKHQKAARAQVLAEVINRHPLADKAGMIEVLDNLEPVPEQSYVVERLMFWRKWSAIEQTLATRNGQDPATFAQEIAEAAAAGDEVTSEWMTLDDLDKKAELDLPAIPLDWPWLNQLMAGGPRIQDSLVVLAGVNVGKTSFLVNVAGAALRAGELVVYLTFEDGPIKIFRRLMQHCCGLKRDSVDEHPTNAKRQMRDFLEGHEAELMVRGMTTKASTVADAARYVKEAEAKHGRKCRILVTDYADCFRPPKKRSEMRQEIREVFEACKALARDQDLVHWTAGQTNRRSLHMGKIDIEHAGESMGKVESADWVIGLGQTPEQENRKQMTLRLAKARDVQKGLDMDLKCDFDTQTISEWV